MKRLSILATTTVLSAGVVLCGGDTVAQQKSLKEQLVGSWTSVSVLVERKDGTKFDPWGPNQKGLTIFTSDGRYSIINTRPDRPKFASNNRLEGTPEENKAVAQGTIFYFGTYSVNEAEKTMTVRIEVSSFPNWEGTEQTRPFTITGDELKWSNPAGTIGGAPAQITMKRTK